MGSRGPDASTNQVDLATNDEQMVERALVGRPRGVRRDRASLGATNLRAGLRHAGPRRNARDATQRRSSGVPKSAGLSWRAKVSSWLHRIAVNQCITRQRRAKVRGETGLEDEAEKNAAVFALPLDVSPARTAEKLERSVAVRRAVGALPSDLRQVV